MKINLSLDESKLKMQIPKFLKFSKFFKNFQKFSKIFKIFQNFSKIFKKFQKVIISVIIYLVKSEAGTLDDY